MLKFPKKLAYFVARPLPKKSKQCNLFSGTALHSRAGKSDPSNLTGMNLSPLSDGEVDGQSLPAL